MIIKTMDPARPDDVDPADPFNAERADHPILETIEIATAGEDNEGSSRELVEPLMRVPGVCAVKLDPENERVVVTFDARRTHTPDLHDAILKSGYRPPRWRINVVEDSGGRSHK
jgi:copper chaperone CopZ